MKRATGLIVLLLSMAALSAGLARVVPLPRQLREDSGPKAGAGHPAVADPALIDAEGYKEILEKYRGKPLLVNFWATWCEPCRDEYPMLSELAKKYAPQGLHIVGISLDGDGEMILVRRFLKRHQPVFRNYRKCAGKEDEFMRAVNAGWSGAIPASFFYAPDGRQIGRVPGAGNRETHEAAIRTLPAAGPNSGQNDRPNR